MTKYFTLIFTAYISRYLPAGSRYESGSPSFLNFNFSCEQITRCQNDLCPYTGPLSPTHPNRICEPKNRPIDCTLHRFSIVTIQYK